MVFSYDEWQTSITSIVLHCDRCLLIVQAQTGVMYDFDILSLYVFTKLHLFCGQIQNIQGNSGKKDS